MRTTAGCAHAPVGKARMWPIKELYVLACYDDALNMLKDKRFVRNRATATGSRRRLPFPLPKAFAAMAQTMIIEDEPEHRRLRTLVHKAFTPRTVAHQEDRIEALSHALLTGSSGWARSTCSTPSSYLEL